MALLAYIAKVVLLLIALLAASIAAGILIGIVSAVAYIVYDKFTEAMEDGKGRA